jgi:hypothetical protein
MAVVGGQCYLVCVCNSCTPLLGDHSQVDPSNVSVLILICLSRITEAVDYLRVLVTLTSRTETARILGPNDHFPAELLSYLHRHGYYHLLSTAIIAVVGSFFS